ncbi:hypothetical protein [Desulfovibrio porci]|nr:hypothetical protein [Desulfovibrio porci]
MNHQQRFSLYGLGRCFVVARFVEMAIAAVRASCLPVPPVAYLQNEQF